jgi:polyhydroxyalkanoate synthase
VRSCYFENRLIRGGWIIGGTPVDLGNNKVPALTIAATKDHIVEPEAAFGLRDVWGGPVTCQSIEGGHVGICVGKALPGALRAWIAA